MIVAIIPSQPPRLIGAGPIQPRRGPRPNVGVWVDEERQGAKGSGRPATGVVKEPGRIGLERGQVGWAELGRDAPDRRQLDGRRGRRHAVVEDVIDGK
jgi:hypothetical protein